MSCSPDSLTRATLSVRQYHGEYAAHVNDHAQVLMGLVGRLELEIVGRAAFVDASCGIVIPAGLLLGFMTRQPARVTVLDAQDAGLQHQRPTAGMAALLFLSCQRFHARLTELTGLTPKRYDSGLTVCRRRYRP